MLVSGLQKLTLLDYPGRVACTVFTGGCGFRCPFCHNASLVMPDRIACDTTPEDVLSFLKKRIGILDGVAVTGGEPLLHKDLGDFLKAVKDMGYAVKLDTNGSFPDRLKEVVGAGLVDRVAMDIKNAPEYYGETVGIRNFDIAPVRESKDFLLSGSVACEFRTTVVKGLHDTERLLRAAEWIAGAKEYYLQQYINSGDVISPDGLDSFSEQEMNGFRDSVAKIIPTVMLRGL